MLSKGLVSWPVQHWEHVMREGWDDASGLSNERDCVDVYSCVIAIYGT